MSSASASRAVTASGFALLVWGARVGPVLFSWFDEERASMKSAQA